MDIVNMILFGSELDEDVVMVYKNVFIEHATEHVVDKCLEDSMAIGKAKGHD